MILKYYSLFSVICIGATWPCSCGDKTKRPNAQAVSNKMKKYGTHTSFSNVFPPSIYYEYCLFGFFFYLLSNVVVLQL